MSDQDFEHVTTDAAVGVYMASSPIFEGIIREVRELSKKKPEATMNAGKVKIVNRILNDFLTILKDEPEGKYLEVLDDEALPQTSDAVLTMVQFESAIQAFYNRYHKYIDGRHYWITSELLSSWEEDGEESEADGTD